MCISLTHIWHSVTAIKIDPCLPKTGVAASGSKYTVNNVPDEGRAALHILSLGAYSSTGGRCLIKIGEPDSGICNRTISFHTSVHYIWRGGTLVVL